jgi:alpha-L-arabinofuranosidase
LDDQNSFEDPVKVSPKTTPLENVGAQFDYTFAPYSLTVLRIHATEK